MDRQRIINLVAAICAVTVFGFTLGLMFPLLSLILEKNGVSPDVIGYNTAMQPLGIVLSIFTIPFAVRKLGAKKTAIVSAILTALVIMSYPFVPVFWWWFGLRILHGFFVSTLFAVSEAWIVRFAEGPWRSRLLALYTSILALSFGGGPSLISFTGINSPAPFIIGATILACAIIPIFFVTDSDVDEEDEKPLSVIGFMLKSPVLVLSVGAFAIIDAAFLGFLPVYAVKKGMEVEMAAFALTMFIVGNTILQFPIGWLADHINKRIVMTGCVIITALLNVFLPHVFGTAFLWPVLLIGGAASAGIYTIGLAELGDRFSGHELTTGTACFSMMWGGGALIGALATGWAFKHFGEDGMPGMLAIVLGAFSLVLLLSLKAHLQKPAAAA